MARLRSVNGSVVNVSEETAAALGSAWTPVEDDTEPEQKPAPRRTRKKADTSADDK